MNFSPSDLNWETLDFLDFILVYFVSTVRCAVHKTLIKKLRENIMKFLETGWRNPWMFVTNEEAAHHKYYFASNPFKNFRFFLNSEIYTGKMYIVNARRKSFLFNLIVEQTNDKTLSVHTVSKVQYEIVY